MSDTPRPEDEDLDDLPGDTPDPEQIPPSMLPRLDFAMFIMSIIGSAYVHLGDAPDPESGEWQPGMSEPNLVLAQQDIELLGLLQDKTKGNLSGEEERVLSQGLYDLRMRYLEVTKGS